MVRATGAGILAGMRSIFACIGIISVSAGMAHGDIYRCTDQDGIVWFMGLPCESGRLVGLDDPVIVSLPALTTGERRTLDRLASPRTSVPVVRANPGRDRSQAMCLLARSGLEDLRHERRRGYPVSRGAELDARQRKLEAQVAAYC